MLIYFNTEGINLYFLFPFISFFCLVGASFFASRAIFGKYAYIQNIIISFGEMLAIIPYLISIKIEEDIYKDSTKRNSNANKHEKDNTKKSLKDNTKKSLAYNYEYNNVEEELSQIKIYHVILLGFADFLQSFFIFYGNELFYSNYQLYFWSSYILFLCIFKKLLLKNSVYRHQIVSFFIFALFDIIYTIFIIKDHYIIYNPFQLIFLIISNCCFSFEIVFEKRLMEKTFISIYKLCFLLGLSTFFYNLILSIIITIITNKIDENDERRKYLFKYSDYFNNIQNILVEIFIIFIFILLYGLYNIFQFITIKFLSPNHALITQLVLALYMTIISKVTGNEVESKTFIFSIIFHIICFFALFIFIEIIHLNFCGISKDTILHIGLRSDFDRHMENLEDKISNTNHIEEIETINCSLKKTPLNKNLERNDSESENSEADYSFD